jgi:hypothetical protein
MPSSKSRIVAACLLTAGFGAAVVLASAAPQLRSALPSNAPAAVAETAPTKTAPQPAADKQDQAEEPGGGIRVEVPSTEVKVDKDRGKVSVRAPHTDVRVDPERGRVQVRAPYVNLDIRW